MASITAPSASGLSTPDGQAYDVKSTVDSLVTSVNANLNPAAVYTDTTGIAMKVAQAKYDITGGDLGTAGAHGLGVSIPANSIIVGSIIDVTETFTDGADDSATLAISVEGANDIVTATAISGGSNIWDQGLQAGVPVMTAATAVKVGAAAKEITVTTADDTIDSGSMVISLFYIPTEVNAS